MFSFAIRALRSPLVQTLALVAACLIGLATVPTSRAGEPVIIELKIAQRSVSGPAVETGPGAGIIRVTQGEAIELRWQSDERAVLHLHGYNVETEIPENGDATTTFKARAAGRFPIEAHAFGHHHAHKVLIYVEVHPR